MSETTCDLMLHPKACPEFRWVGQAFYSCEAFGQPFWLHTHDLRMRRDRRVRVAITRGEAERVRARWEPAMRADGYTPKPYAPEEDSHEQ